MASLNTKTITQHASKTPIKLKMVLFSEHPKRYNIYLRDTIVANDSRFI